MVLQAPDHKVIIHDARKATRAGQNPKPVEGDGYELFVKLLERASKTVAIDRDGNTIVPALVLPKDGTTYKPVKGFNPVVPNDQEEYGGIMTEVKMFGSGSAYRLIDIAKHDEKGNLVEYTILAVTSNKSEQKEFFKQIGIPER